VATFSRSAFASASRYGRTALLVIWRFADGLNWTSVFGFMHPISSAICRDSPRTTEVEQPCVV